MLPREETHEGRENKDTEMERRKKWETGVCVIYQS